MDNRHRQSLEGVAFTYDWYRTFLDRLGDAGYDFRTFSDGVGSGDVLLRHDVDLSVDKALATARIEADRGIRATYCFLLGSALYNPFDRDRREKIRAIQALGHEIALHFSTHEYWTDEERLETGPVEARVESEQEILGSILPSVPETVSFHVPPSWVLGRDFERFRNTYAPAFFSEIGYVADSGQRWRDTPPDVTDYPSSIQVLTHPGLWGETDEDFETRVEQSIADACGHAEEKARMEFLEETADR